MYRRNTKGWYKHLDFIVLDLLCLQAAFLLSYWLRMGLQNPYADPTYRNMGILIEIFDIAVMLLYGTLSGVLRRGKYIEFSKTLKHTIWLFAVEVLYLFAAKISTSYSRAAMFLMFGIYFVSTYLVRCFRKRQLYNRPATRSARTMLVVTTLDRAEKTVQRIALNEHGYVKVVGLALLDADLTGHKIADVPVIGTAEEAVDFICREWVDEVFLRYPAGTQIPWESIRRLSESGVTLHLKLDDGYDTIGNVQVVENLGGYTVITATMNSMSHRQAIMKRGMDILGGLVGCAITGVLFLFLAPAIKKASPDGPVFFKQTRVGRNGKQFQMYKFRSMYPDAEERKAEYYAQNRVDDGMMFKMDFDPRVIGNEVLPDGTQKRGIGDFIRRRSLDEFPQFFNVLKGEMSMVGTRPPTLDEWEKYELHHRARLSIKPGITGLWQVSGRSDIQDFEEVVKLDVQYIREWSMGLDIRILLKTIRQVLTGKGAL